MRVDSSLLATENSAITSGASVVSSSWGDDLGDLFTDAATGSLACAAGGS